MHLAKVTLPGVCPLPSGVSTYFSSVICITLSYVSAWELELESPWRARRKALRGMGAACGCLGEHSEALGYMEQVVSISEANEDMNGLADAYGVTADLYTELGDFEHAALWYDKYIETMNKTL